MDLETKLTENFYFKPNMKNQENPFIVPSSQGFLQDFNHIDKFNPNGTFFNHVSGVQNFGPSDKFSFADNDFKPFVENSGNGNGHAFVMDNFLHGGYELNNLSQRNNQVETMVTNQSNYFPFNINIPQETKPLSFVAPDEVSCMPSMRYYKRFGMNRNSKAYPLTRKIEKIRKNSNVVKGQWTVEEDGLLIQLVEQNGLRKWSRIAQMLPGRIGKQCRERWHNHLRPDIKKDIWSEEEDRILIKAHGEIGNKWAEIAKKLPGRTENSIKNHWNATKRRQYSKRKCRSKYPRGNLLQDYIKSLNLDKNPPKDYRKKSSTNVSVMKNNTNKDTTIAISAQSQSQSQKAEQFCPSDECLVPSCGFDDVPDFCFDESLFQDGCSIDSLLDDVKIMEGKKHCDVEKEIMESMFGAEVKKEMDLIDMVFSCQ
ncbi:transcription factor MYB98-like [Vicia villosa]|uniref:transcription factor MYB98-like n=1 Tax=Vicia villosa TaxID=3911 RepID=UPI00273BDDC3|nr:transcription factor MYB98-like [Vicia villosa]